MSRRLRVYAEAPEPSLVAGRDENVPWCSLTCRHAHHPNGKRMQCRLVGGLAPMVCIPAVKELCAERDDAVRLLRMLDNPEARHPDVAEFLDELEESQ